MGRGERGLGVSTTAVPRLDFFLSLVRRKLDYCTKKQERTRKENKLEVQESHQNRDRVFREGLHRVPYNTTTKKEGQTK